MEIKNCVIEFQCPKRWHALKETNDPNIRFCEYCFQDVYLVENEAQLREQAAQGRCVAILDEYEGLMGKIVLNDSE